MHSKLHRLTVFLTICLIVLVNPQSVMANQWWTKSGNPEHHSYVPQTLGRASPTWFWALDVGASGTQPVFVENQVYHVAGGFLWRIPIELSGGSTVEDLEMPYEVVPGGQVSSSTPTYSPQTGMLYLGTPSGTVWVFDTRSDWTNPVRRSYQSTSCPIIASPLVFHIDGRDLVLVTNKHPDEGCIDQTEIGGKAFLHWGLDTDDPSDDGHDVFEDFKGSWMSASPVPISERAALVAADGQCKIAKVMIGGHSPSYTLTAPPNGVIKCNHGASGFAGSFTVVGSTAYILDTGTEGYLWALEAQTGEAPSGWPSQHISLAHQIEGMSSATAFTNTEPAVDVAGSTLYVSLRNYRGNDYGGPLRGCGPKYWETCSNPGAPGAVVAIDIETGSRVWAQTLNASERPSHLPVSDTYNPAINSTPLVLPGLMDGVVLFGDTNGQLHAYATATGAKVDFAVNSGCVTGASLNLLDGKIPRAISRTYDTATGVSSDPMFASGKGRNLIIAGASWDTGGRLVAIRVGDTYNLRWDAPLTLTHNADGTVTARSSISLHDTDKTLEELRPNGVQVHWYAISGSPSDVKSFRLLGAPTTLPKDMRVGGPSHPSSVTFRPQAQDGAQPYIVGLIDAPVRGIYSLWKDPFAASLIVGDNSAATCAEQQLITEDPSPSTLQKASTFDLDDNYAVEQLQLGNVKLQIEAPVVWDEKKGPHYEVTIRVTNESSVDLVVPVVVSLEPEGRAGWSLGRRQVTVPAGHTVSDVRQVYVQECPDTYKVQAEANPGRTAFPELNADDNAAAAVTFFSCEPVPPPPAWSGWGPGKTFIVPSDCVVQIDHQRGKICAGDGPTFEPWW